MLRWLWRYFQVLAELSQARRLPRKWKGQIHAANRTDYTSTFSVLLLPTYLAYNLSCHKHSGMWRNFLIEKFQACGENLSVIIDISGLWRNFTDLICFCIVDSPRLLRNLEGSMHAEINLDYTTTFYSLLLPTYLSFIIIDIGLWRNLQIL